MPKPIIAFIGAGNIARCFIAGLLKTKCDPTSIIVSNRSKDKLIAFKKEFNVVIAENNSAAVEAADIVILSVKPPAIKEVCQEISLSIQRKNPLIISFATATPIKYITDVLAAHKVSVVRAMTNLAVEIGLGTSALFANNEVTPEQKIISEKIFNSVGNTFWVNHEDELTKITPLVGCAPAYLFLFIEALQQAAVSRGISETLAAKVAQDVVCGAAILAQQSKIPIAELRKMVTTPKGVTAAALGPLMGEGGIFSLTKKAFEVGEARCHEITRDLFRRVIA